MFTLGTVLFVLSLQEVVVVDQVVKVGDFLSVTTATSSRPRWGNFLGNIVFGGSLNLLVWRLQLLLFLVSNAHIVNCVLCDLFSDQSTF